MLEIELSDLKLEDFDEIVAAFESLGWHKPRKQYETYLLNQVNGSRTVVVCRHKEEFAGYVTLVWGSAYPDFKAGNIPEISDLNVLPHFRRNGIGTRLIIECESVAKSKGFREIGLGVGLTADYGNAQRIYFRLGYVPDGKGLHYGIRAIEYNQSVVADDYLVLYLSKVL